MKSKPKVKTDSKREQRLDKQRMVIFVLLNVFFLVSIFGLTYSTALLKKAISWVDMTRSYDSEQVQAINQYRELDVDRADDSFKADALGLKFDYNFKLDTVKYRHVYNPNESGGSAIAYFTYRGSEYDHDYSYKNYYRLSNACVDPFAIFVYGDEPTELAVSHENYLAIDSKVLSDGRTADLYQSISSKCEQFVDGEVSFEFRDMLRTVDSY